MCEPPASLGVGMSMGARSGMRLCVRVAVRSGVLVAVCHR
jgi:hypothetical protein